MAHQLLKDSNSNSPFPAAPMQWPPVEMNFLPEWLLQRHSANRAGRVTLSRNMAFCLLVAVFL